MRAQRQRYLVCRFQQKSVCARVHVLVDSVEVVFVKHAYPAKVRKASACKHISRIYLHCSCFFGIVTCHQEPRDAWLQGHYEALVKFTGAVTAAQIALLPIAGVF